MPSLIRFLMTLMVLGGLAYAGMFALTVFVEPNPREMIVRVPRDKINPRPVPRVAVEPGQQENSADDSGAEQSQ